MEIKFPHAFEILRSEHRLHIQYDLTKPHPKKISEVELHASVVLIGIWLNDNISGEVLRKKNDWTFEYNLDGHQMDEFDKIENKFWAYVDSINYRNQLNNPKFIRELERKILAKKNISALKQQYLELVNSKEKDYAQASEILVQHILKENKIYTTRMDEKSEVWIYQNGIYVPNGRSVVKEILRQILEEQFNNHIYNQVIIKIESDTYIEYKAFFDNNYKELVPVQNGILNVLTGELSEYTPEKIFFSKLEVNYNSEAKCPMILKFLSEVLAKEEDVKVYLEMVGFCLYKEYTFEKAFILVGDGRNGKGKSLELIKRLVGTQNVSAISLANMDASTFNLSSMINKMVNIAGDIGNQDLKDTSTFKSLTGRDPLSIQRKFMNSIEITNFAKCLFACNELPIVYDTSRGFWSRWILLEYPYTFLDPKEIAELKNKTGFKLKDNEIIEKITTPEELSGLLNLAISNLRGVFARGGFSQTTGTEEVKQKWIRKANSFNAFASDFLEEDYSGFIIKRELRRRYANYCKTHKIQGKSDLVIKRVMEENFGSTSERKMIEGELEHVFSGVKFKENINCQCQDKKTLLGRWGGWSYDYRNGGSPDTKTKLLDFIAKNDKPVYFFPDFYDLGISDEDLDRALQILTFEGFLLQSENGWRKVC